MSPKAFCRIALLLFVGGVAVNADPLIPVAEGTTWFYAVNDEPGGPSTLKVQITGSENFEGKPALRVETSDGEKVTRTELRVVDDRGVVCLARTGRDGAMTKLEPPELIVPAELKAGASFDVEGDAAGVKMHQHFTIFAEESVFVPAGNLRAFRLHCDAKSLMSVAIDRWFVPGTGIVKELTTVRGPSGGLLQRTTLELQKSPELIARPTPTPSPVPTPTLTPTPSPTAAPTIADTAATGNPRGSSPEKRLQVEVSSDPAAGMQTQFHSDIEKIYVRWHGHGLPENARVRVAWVAEDVGDLVEPNFIVDETETEAPSPDASARFTLGRPEDGWAEGKYRVEFYIDDQLEETIKVTIVK